MFKCDEGLTAFPLEEIAFHAFYNCSSLKSLSIGGNCKAIGSYAFQACSALESVILEEGVETISEGAFRNCTALASVTIPSTLTSVGTDAFLSCDNLKKVNITDMKAWCEIAFEDHMANPTNKSGALYKNNQEITAISETDLAGATKINAYALYNCSKITSVAIPATVESIGSNAFENCSGITSMSIPATVNAAVNVFATCTNISSVTITGSDAMTDYDDSRYWPWYYSTADSISVTISEGITHIGDYAFNLAGISEINLPSTITSIGESAFNGCQNISEIVIPAKVTSIESNAFYGCTKLEKMTFEGNLPAIGDGAFSGLMMDAVYPSDNANWTKELRTANINIGGANRIYWVPSGGYAAVSEITAEANDNEGIEISWKDVGADYYGIYYSVNGGELETAFDYCTGTSWTHDQLDPGTEYTYTVTAHYYSYGNNINTLKSVKTASAAPKLKKVTQVSVNTYYNDGLKCVRVSWGAGSSKDAYYQVYRKVGENGTYQEVVADNTSCYFQDNDIIVGNTYYYYIVSHANGEGEAYQAVSEVFSGTPALQEFSMIEAFATDIDSIKVEWEYCSGADGYLVYRSESADGDYGAPIADVTDTIYEDTGLSLGRTYYYKVRAYVKRNQNGDYYTAYTDSASASTPDSDSAAVSAPDNVTVEQTENYVIRLSWDKKSDAKGYNIYQVLDGVDSFTEQITDGDTTTYTINGLYPGEICTYKVSFYTDLAEGPMSAAVSITIKDMPENNTSGDDTTGDNTSADDTTGNSTTGNNTTGDTAKLKAPSRVKASSAGYNSVKLTWKKVSGAAGYEIYRSASKKGTYKKVNTIKSGSTVSYKDTKLICGKTYYYKVCAYKKVSGSKVSGTLSSIKSAKPVPAKTTVKLSSAGSGKIKVSWKKVSGASGYEVYRSTSKKGKYKKVKTLKKSSSVTFKNTDLTKGKKYYYKVRAYRVVKGKKVYGSYSSVKALNCK